MSAPRKSKGRLIAYVWLASLAVFLAFMIIWPVLVLASPTSQPLLRGIAVFELIVLVAVGVGSVYLEKKRKRLIRAACQAEGFTDIEIQTRKTHYRVSLGGPQGSQVRKCRVSSRSVEWIA